MNIQLIPVDKCIHYRGFRYGGFGNNIYEDYIIGLATGANLRQLRGQFLRRILAFSGLDFASILNVRLERKYPPWIFPWSLSSIRKLNFSFYLPASNPDIVCHYSREGVLVSHVNREFLWLERAYAAMISGYKPESFGYITVLCMKRDDQNRYLVVDGNHRLSTLYSLGVKSVAAKVKISLLTRSSASRFWPGVLSGRYKHEDARAIFNRYFIDGNFVLSEVPVLKLIEDEVLLPCVIRRDPDERLANSSS